MQTPIGDGSNRAREQVVIGDDARDWGVAGEGRAWMEHPPTRQRGVHWLERRRSFRLYGNTPNARRDMAGAKGAAVSLFRLRQKPLKDRLRKAG